MDDIQLDVNDTKANAILTIPESGSGPGVLLLHAWWGLNPFFKALAERFAEAGFVCLAPDLFEGVTANTREEAMAMEAQRGNEDHIFSTVRAAKDYLLAHPACTSEQIGAVGFSFGAAWVLVAASKWAEQIGAGVLFYGVWRADFEHMRAPFLGHFTDADEWEPIENTLDMEKQMRDAGLDVKFHIYPGLAHWFVETDRPEYDAAAAGLAWERTFAFLKKNL